MNNEREFEIDLEEGYFISPSPIGRNMDLSLRAKRSSILNKKQGEEDREAEMEKQELIQINLIIVLARYYSKLEGISDSLNYTSFPFEEDDKIHLRLDPNEVSNCPVFNELVEKNNLLDRNFMLSYIYMIGEV